MRSKVMLLGLLAMALLLSLLVAACSGSSSTSTSAAGSSAAGSTTTTAGNGTTVSSTSVSQDSTIASVTTGPNDTEDLFSPAQDVLQAVYTSVVNIKVSANVGGQSGQGVGSGVVYTNDGLILTNDHVVTLDGSVTSGQQMVVTFSDGSTSPATLVGTDATADVAVIKVNKTGLTPVTFASSGDVKLAEWAVVIGSPLDFANSVTLGIVSGLNRTLDIGTGAPLTGLMQVDAAISPGNSGGGCFDIRGRFIGMPEVYLPPGQTGAENIGFAIPADTVLKFAKQLSGK